MKQLQVTLITFFMFTTVSVLAQDVELPIHWEGEGNAQFLSRDGLERLSIDVNITIDEDGYVSGDFSTSEGKATIKKFYYTNESNGSRKLMLILVAEDADEPFIALMDSRILNGKFLYGEMFLKKYEPNGDIEKSMYLSDSSATEMFPDYLPTSLKNFKAKSIPYGVFSVLGDNK